MGTELSLGRKYDILTGLVDEAAELRRAFLVNGVEVNSHIDAWTAGFAGWAAKRGRFTPDSWNLISDAMEQATDEMKKDPLFPAASDAYWPEELARHVIRELSLDRETGEGLLRVQEIREQQNKAISSAWRRPLVWISSAVTVAAIVASQVPKEVFEHTGSNDYAAYRFWIFVALATCVGFILFFAFLAFMIGFGTRNRRVREQLELNRVLLLYVDAVLTEGQSKRSAARRSDIATSSAEPSRRHAI